MIFETESDKLEFIEYWKESTLGKFIRYFNSKGYRGNNIKVRQAKEPEDIIYENLGKTLC